MALWEEEKNNLSSPEEPNKKLFVPLAVASEDLIPPCAIKREQFPFCFLSQIQGLSLERLNQRDNPPLKILSQGFDLKLEDIHRLQHPRAL